MRHTLMKTIVAGSMAAMMIFGTNGTVLAKVPEVPSVVQPRFSEIRSQNIRASFSTDTSVRCYLSIRGIYTSTEISGTLTLSGSDGSEYNWNVSGTGSASFNRTISGCTADAYTLTFTGYCGCEYVDNESVATR